MINMLMEFDKIIGKTIKSVEERTDCLILIFNDNSSMILTGWDTGEIFINDKFPSTNSVLQKKYE